MPDPRLKSFTDDKLVLLAKVAADTDSYGELVRRHEQGLIAFLTKFCGSVTQAEDLAQNTLVKGFTHLHQFKGTSSFKTWLYRIGYREFLRDVRRSQSDARLQEQIRQDIGTFTIKDPSQMMDISQALEALKPQERSSIVLCDIFGFTHKEAARIQKLPLGTVKSHVKRGRAKVGQLLEVEIADE
ncbi:MAG: RNA polymerase sigma factor [Pseudomonadota bacterium]